MSDKVATSTTYASSIITLFGGVISLNEFLMLAGFFLGLATFVYNIVYKERLLAALKTKGSINIIQEIDK